MPDHFDLLVIGAGPAGEKGAAQAAYFGKTVCLVERAPKPGGNSVNTGGDFLPGNGNTGSNEGIYVYTLAFNITGTGSGTVTNAVSIGITISADDSWRR